MKWYCPTETAAHWLRPAPPFPIPPPSATGNPHSSSPSCCPHSLAQSDIWSPAPRSCNTRVSALPFRSAHCTTSHNHTSQSSAPDDSPPSPIPHGQNCSHDLSPT